MIDDNILEAIQAVSNNPLFENGFAEYSTTVVDNKVSIYFPKTYLSINLTISKGYGFLNKRIEKFEYQFHYNVIKENSAFVVKEIEMRGIEINVDIFLKSILENLNALEVSDKSISNIVFIITNLLLFSKVTICVLEKLHINRAIWDEDFILHEEWQKYFAIRPEDAGFLDACMDEILLLPDALLLLFSMPFGEKKFQQRVSDVIHKATYKSMMEDPDNMLKYPSVSKRGHFVLQTIFSVSFTLDGIYNKLIPKYN